MTRAATGTQPQLAEDLRVEGSILRIPPHNQFGKTFKAWLDEQTHGLRK